jgi:hypothetical protein
MRARADALGGSLRAGPGSAGGFAVHATLPLRPPPGDSAHDEEEK